MAILDLIPPEVMPFDVPTSKTLPRTKHEVDRMIRCRDMAVQNFPKCEIGRWSVGRLLVVGPQYIILFSRIPLRYVRNVAHEE